MALAVNKRRLIQASAAAQNKGAGVAPDFSRTFDQVVGAGYAPLYDYSFGTGAAPAGSTPIPDVAALETDWMHWARNLPNDKTAINAEVQRYVDFSHPENFVFAPDALELTATLPNGAPVGTTSTTLSAGVTNSRIVTVADASAVLVGQVVSLGAAQRDQVQATATLRLDGTLTATDTLSLTFLLARIGQADVVITVAADGAATRQSLGQAIVDQVNAHAALSALGIKAYKQIDPLGSYCVTYPQWSQVDAPEFGFRANGSLDWVVISPSKTGTIVHESKATLCTTWVVSKSGNVLTLNHPITATNGQTLHINSARILHRTTEYTTSSATIPIGDTTGIEVGQAVQFGFNDNNLRRVLSKTATDITVSAAVAVTGGLLITVLPVHVGFVQTGVTSALSFTMANALPTGVRVGMQVQQYNTSATSNSKVTAINGATITVDVPITIGSGNNAIFYEPVQSAQIWSKWGVMPGELNRNWIAMELEADFPDIADAAAWPAFWLFYDPTMPSGQANPANSGGEIDMVEVFNQWGIAGNSNTHRPANASPTSTVLKDEEIFSQFYTAGNNVGRKRRKIQLIWSVDRVYYYIDGRWVWTRNFIYSRGARPQVAANLAVGSTNTSFNSNGFFPIDFSQFPMKFRLHRMRILAA